MSWNGMGKVEGLDSVRMGGEDGGNSSERVKSGENAPMGVIGPALCRDKTAQIKEMLEDVAHLEPMRR